MLFRYFLYRYLLKIFRNYWPRMSWFSNSFIKWFCYILYELFIFWFADVTTVMFYLKLLFFISSQQWDHHYNYLSKEHNTVLVPMSAVWFSLHSLSQKILFLMSMIDYANFVDYEVLFLTQDYRSNRMIPVFVEWERTAFLKMSFLEIWASRNIFCKKKTLFWNWFYRLD